MGDAGDPHGLCCAPYADIGIMNQFVKRKRTNFPSGD
jgi:hypothetical protein